MSVRRKFVLPPRSNNVIIEIRNVRSVGRPRIVLIEWGLLPMNMNVTPSVYLGYKRFLPGGNADVAPTQLRALPREAMWEHLLTYVTGGVR